MASKLINLHDKEKHVRTQKSPCNWHGTNLEKLLMRNERKDRQIAVFGPECDKKNLNTKNGEISPLNIVI